MMSPDIFSPSLDSSFSQWPDATWLLMASMVHGHRVAAGGAERHVELGRAVGGPRDDIGGCGDARRRDAAGGRRQGRLRPG